MFYIIWCINVILLLHLSCSLHEYQVWDDARHQKLPKEFSVTFPQEVNFYVPIILNDLFATISSRRALHGRSPYPKWICGEELQWYFRLIAFIVVGPKICYCCFCRSKSSCQCCASSQKTDLKQMHWEQSWRSGLRHWAHKKCFRQMLLTDYHKEIS